MLNREPPVPPHESGVSRRKFLTSAGLVIGGVAALSVLPACNNGTALATTPQFPTSTVAGPASDATQYGFLVKVNKCTSCLKCVEACVVASKTPAYEEPRRKVTAYTRSDGKECYIPTSCMHCASPACESVCPARAISKGEGGIVVVDKERCIGCKYCYQACPYSVPNYHAQGMDKCDYCLGNDVPLGEQPYCIKACRFDALHYGLISEFPSKVTGDLIRVEGSTGSSLYLSYE